MIYRPLGKTGASVSVFSLGAMVFGWKTSEDEAGRLCDAAVDAGINLIDTSNSYGRGKSEEILGRWLNRSARRNRILVASKFHYWKEGDDPATERDLERHIVCQCEASLDRLGVETIDLYQIHRPFEGPRPGETLETTIRVLDQLVKAGKVRWTGTSTFSAAQVNDAGAEAVKHGRTPFSCEQSPYNLLDRSIEKELLPMAGKLGLGVLVWSPMAEGILSGKYRRGQALPEDSRYAKVTRPEPYLARLTPAVFDAIEALEKLAREKGWTLPQLALTWCLSGAGVSSVIIGPSKTAQLQENLGALTVRLDGEDLTRIEAICPSGTAKTKY